MFCDWLSVWQQHDPNLPDFNGGRVVSIDGGCGLARRDTIDTDGVVAEAWALCGDDAEIEFDTPKFTQHKGSYETTLLIRMVGGKVEVRGNASKFGRLDNLFGMGIDDGIAVYNEVLESLGLPVFTEGQLHRNYNGKDWIERYDGAHVIRADITQNMSVGSGHVADFHRWLGQQKLYRSAPGSEDLDQFARWDWNTVALSSSFLMHVKAYDKGQELGEVSLPHYLKRLKAAAKDGRINQKDVRPLYQEAEDYLDKLALWCAEQGVSRLEWSFKSRWFAQHSGLGHWRPNETESALFAEAEKHMGKISERAVVYQADALDALTRPERGALAMWKAGATPEEIGTKRTFYRLRAAILKKTGHDIAARPLAVVSESRPVFFQVRALSLRDAPVWYQRAVVPMRLAA